MALIPTSELINLKDAATVKAVADSAAQEHQLHSVAYAINTAANTGEHRTMYNGELSDTTITALTDKSYTVTLDNYDSCYVIGGF